MPEPRSRRKNLGAVGAPRGAMPLGPVFEVSLATIPEHVYPPEGLLGSETVVAFIVLGHALVLLALSVL